MSPLEALQLIGYSTAAALHLWMGALLVKRRRLLSRLERALTVLALTVGLWHAGNLFVALHTILDLSGGRWDWALRLTDSLAVVGITLSYSLLLHVHLHLWANARRRPLTRTERARVYLSYVPALFLVYAVPKLWTKAYAPMDVRLAHLLVPFALWAAYVLVLVAVTDFLIARRSQSLSERRLLRTLAASFVGIAGLIVAVYAWGLGEGTVFGLYLKTIANLGSLVPTALLAYHVYRYRYLELIIQESLVVASFAAIVLVVYLYGIRTFGEWVTARYGLRAGAVESIMILLLALVASPLRRWLDKRFRHLFEREAALYRDVVARIGAHAGRFQQLPELLRFVEARTVEALRLRRVRIVAFQAAGQAGSKAAGRAASDKAGEWNAPNGVGERDAGGSRDGGDERGGGDDREAEKDWKGDDWEGRVLEQSRASGWLPVEGDALLRGHGYELAYVLRREAREVGLMFVDAAPDALTYDVRAVLEILAGQVAIAIEDSRLVEENVQLERRLAHGERLAALGQMAATVAHEVKNPLSAIKSIAQVMREDEEVRREYARDLDLIVGEADRLSRSVTQMLSFARSAPAADAPVRADELVAAVVQLLRNEAERREVVITNRAGGVAVVLDGARAAAVRDALSNLLLNALQATPAGGGVSVGARHAGDGLIFSVADGGPGVAAELRERIWEPFFTTKQRGTGLGLAIVRKRIEEVGGAARLAATQNGGGACFELVVPLEGRSTAG